MLFVYTGGRARLPVLSPENCAVTVGPKTTRSVAVPFPEAEPIWTPIVGRPRASVAVAAVSSVSVKLVTPALITVL